MNTYKSLAIVNINTGIVRLDRDQVRRRKYNLRNIKDDLFEITMPIQFKAGEVFCYDGSLPKTLVEVVGGDELTTDDIEKATLDIADFIEDEKVLAKKKSTAKKNKG